MTTYPAPFHRRTPLHAPQTQCTKLSTESYPFDSFTLLSFTLLSMVLNPWPQKEHMISCIVVRLQAACRGSDRNLHRQLVVLAQLGFCAS